VQQSRSPCGWNWPTLLTREIVLDGEIAVPNYRGVTDIDDLQTPSQAPAG